MIHQNIYSIHVSKLRLLNSNHPLFLKLTVRSYSQSGSQSHPQLALTSPYTRSGEARRLIDTTRDKERENKRIKESMAYKDSIYTDQDQDMLLNNLNLELHKVDRDPWYYVMTWLATIAVTFSTRSHIYGNSQSLRHSSGHPR